MKINWSADLIHFLQTAWIPIVEVTAGILIGPRVKKMIVKAADKSQDKGLMTFLGSTANIAIIALSFIMAAEALGIKVSSIVSLVSALGLGVALALKGNMANVAGGIQILVTKPFKIGDYIQVAGHRGYVTTIELMFTTIRTDNQKEAVIPNATIVEDTITNYTKYPYVRVKVPFSVAVGNDMTKIRTEALELMKQNPLLEKSQPCYITVREISSGYVTMEAIGYVQVKDHELCRHQLAETFALNLSIYQPQPASIEEVELVHKEKETEEQSDKTDSKASETFSPETQFETRPELHPETVSYATVEKKASSASSASSAAAVSCSGAPIGQSAASLKSGKSKSGSKSQNGSGPSSSLSAAGSSSSDETKPGN